MTQRNAKTLKPAKERRAQNRQEMIDLILEIALDDMRVEGVSSLSLHRVAKRVGMRVQSLYNYFDNKMAVYEALFTRGMRQFRAGAFDIMDEHGVTPEGIQATLTYIMTFAVENPVLFQILFERPVPGFVPTEEGLSESEQLDTRSLAEFEDAIGEGQITSRLSATQAHSLLVSFAHGLTTLHLSNEPHLPPGEGRFGSLIPLAAEALELVFKQDACLD